jgi:hypothetical protein
VRHYFYGWRAGGVSERINFELLLQAGEAAGREPSHSADVFDSQSVKTTEAGGPRGFDAAKKSEAARHVITDTTGLLVGAEVRPDMQDCDGAPPLSPPVTVSFRGCAISSPTALIRATSC